MLPKVLSLFLVLVSVSAIAQNQTEKNFKRFLASISVGTVPLPGSPTSILPGAEVFITPRFSVFNEIALQTEKNKNVDSTAHNKKYFRYKGEVRFYLNDESRRVMPYFAAQFTTAQRSFDVKKTWTYFETTQEDSAYQYSSASISSPVKTITSQFGIAIQGYDNFYIDLNCGVGARFVSTEYSNVSDLKVVKDRGFFARGLNSSYRFIGNKTRWQVNLGFRISYHF